MIESGDFDSSPAGRRSQSLHLDESSKDSYIDKMHAKEISWLCLFPLIFSLFYFIPLLFTPYSPYNYILLFLAYPLFVVLYLRCRLHHEYALGYIFAISLLAMAVSVIHDGAYTFTWYAAYCAGYLFTVKRSLVIMLYLGGSLWACALLSDIPIEYFLAYRILPFFGLYVYGHVNQKILRQERIKSEKNRQIKQLAAIAERERLARDMHDILGHNLTAINLKAQLAVKSGRVGDIDKALKEIEDVAKLASGALGDIREAISQYKRMGFYEQLSSLVQLLHDAGFSVQRELINIKLDARQESGLMLIITEAITNILRHSDGNKVAISLSPLSSNSNEPQYKLSIKDNGSESVFRPGNGITGIYDRAQEIGADINIQRANGFGIDVIF